MSLGSHVLPGPVPGQDEPLIESLLPDSAKLLIFFGGIAGEMGIPQFEFYKASNVIHDSKIFVRDVNQAWYQRGLPRLADDAEGIARHLRARIEASGATDVRFIGNSMGGFAALLFCAMLRRGRAIAFAPQTFVGRASRERYGDRRWARQIGRLHASPRDGDILDLRPWLLDHCPELPATVYVSERGRLDMLHADELSDFPQVDIRVFPDGGHGLVRVLRDQGLLENIIRL